METTEFEFCLCVNGADSSFLVASNIWFVNAGGVAGASVDLILFPLDTIKTRLQSPQGFKKAGGFRGIYAGVPSTAIGSFPNAAAFFLTYEYVKWFLHTDSSSYWMPTKHMLAASAGEVIPFSLVQFPLWEYLKALWSWRQDHAVDSWQSAVCGAFAGYSQASSRGWPPSAWGVSSSWVLMTKPAACCPERADRVGEAERHTRFPEERGLRENAAAIAHRGCNLQSARARGCLQLGRRRPRPEQGNRVRGRSLNGLLGISQ
ncbi:PREDICTED: S-adenosylmethionine mitochondrial carrier protein isoform X5 [Chinchilla lanigera]|uniref:S-adenosylmethionine mitochondrial carrier protein isoform X5 n=1 Tax=Chinchilla lanigera TaxID=34839 RepID=UPI000697EDC4|nr:PREDICTED: S-adenosylmethionine mitochondrial carrier protein isoform X5 [Chinchilla lanigera]